jgi:hypothetical protein
MVVIGEGLYLDENPLHIPLCQSTALVITTPKVASLDNLVNSHLSADVWDTRNLYIAK